MGPPLSDTFSKTLGFDAALTEKCLFTYRDYYLNQGGALNCTVYPGVLEVIAKSQAAGVTNSLATSKGESGTILVGEHYDFLKYFDVLGTASNDRSRSAKADVISYAYEGLKKINADLTKVILIGDRIHDVEGARHHGIEVCLVKWGFGDEAEWAEADYLVSNTQELEELLGL
jgi:phosphoglycolate phosphatase